MIVERFQSDEKDKGFEFILGDGSVVHFGSPRYQNFAIRKDQGGRRQLYIVRHKKKWKSEQYE